MARNMMREKLHFTQPATQFSFWAPNCTEIQNCMSSRPETQILILSTISTSHPMHLNSMLQTNSSICEYTHLTGHYVYLLLIPVQAQGYSTKLITTQFFCHSQNW